LEHLLLLLLLLRLLVLLGLLLRLFLLLVLVLLLLLVLLLVLLLLLLLLLLRSGGELAEHGCRACGVRRRLLQHTPQLADSAPARLGCREERAVVRVRLHPPDHALGARARLLRALLLGAVERVDQRLHGQLLGRVGRGARRHGTVAAWLLLLRWRLAC
jgi:hypothetical protein